MPEAPILSSDEQRPRLNWQLPVLLVVGNLIGMGVLWGMYSEKIEELVRTRDQQERHIEIIDTEVATLSREVAELSGANKAFQDEMLRTFQSIDKRLAVLESRSH